MLGLPLESPPDERMSGPKSTQTRIESLAARDGRYAVDAYHFVFESLDFVLERDGEGDARASARDDRHISVTELLDGMRAYAIDQFGPLARHVLERWGIFRTEDFGEIVFRLVENRLLNKQESDRKIDFRNAFNFREAFDKAWRPAPGVPR